MRIHLNEFACDVTIERKGASGIWMALIAAQDGRFGVVDVEVGEPLAQISCAPEAWINAPGEVCVRAYAENDGIVGVLVREGVVHPPHIHLDLRGGRALGPRRVGRPDEAEAYVAVCRLTDAALAELPCDVAEDLHE